MVVVRCGGEMSLVPCVAIEYVANQLIFVLLHSVTVVARIYVTFRFYLKINKLTQKLNFKSYQGILMASKISQFRFHKCSANNFERMSPDLFANRKWECSLRIMTRTLCRFCKTKKRNNSSILHIRNQNLLIRN